VTWSDVAVAGAFVFGIAFGSVLTGRIMRYAMDYFRKQQDKE
jgi:hypothetical protein